MHGAMTATRQPQQRGVTCSNMGVESEVTSDGRTGVEQKGGQNEQTKILSTRTATLGTAQLCRSNVPLPRLLPEHHVFCCHLGPPVTVCCDKVIEAVVRRPRVKKGHEPRVRFA
jgi:hypothetical protein